MTSLSSGAIGGDRGNVLNTANLHSSAGESAESRLGTGSRGLGSGSSGGTELDVKGVDAELKKNEF